METTGRNLSRQGDDAEAGVDSSEELSEDSRDSTCDETSAWHVVVAKVRIDAFNQESLVRQLQEAQAAGHKAIGIDLRATRFLSLQAIRFITQFASSLAEAGGRLSLIAPAEKTKRHFEIYGSLESVAIFRAGEKISIASSSELKVTPTNERPMTPEVSALIADAVSDQGPSSDA